MFDKNKLGLITNFLQSLVLPLTYIGQVHLAREYDNAALTSPILAPSVKKLYKINC